MVVDVRAAVVAGARWSQTAWMWRGSPPASQAALTRLRPASRWLLDRPRRRKRWPTCSRRVPRPLAPTAASASSTPMQGPRSALSTSPPVTRASPAHPCRSAMPHTSRSLPAVLIGTMSRVELLRKYISIELSIQELLLSGDISLPVPCTVPACNPAQSVSGP